MPPPDDDLDDRPRRRRDDDYEDDRGGDGGRRPARRKKKGMSGGTIAAIVGGSLLAALLVCGGVFYLLFASVGKVREAAARAKATNNLKQVAIGLHAYGDTYGRLPRPYLQPPDGDPPADPARRLSWRAEMLPYIEQGSLYHALKPAEAWDGPANRLLTLTAIPTYSDPGLPSNQTRYRVFVGGGALFDDPPQKPVTLVGIPDGTSNTIFAVEAGSTVPWAQYNELPFDPAGPLPPLGRPDGGIFLTAMADGSVRAVRKDVDPAVLKAAITRAGGEQLPADW